jgi:hypothetical protein
MHRTVTGRRPNRRAWVAVWARQVARTMAGQGGAGVPAVASPLRHDIPPIPCESRTAPLNGRGSRGIRKPLLYPTELRGRGSGLKQKLMRSTKE